MARDKDAPLAADTAFTSSVQSPSLASHLADPEKSVPSSQHASIQEDVGDRPTIDMTHRKLKPRHIQLIGIGGSIGTALFVQIGKGLLSGGPGSLFLAFTLWYVLPPGCFFFFLRVW
ncbi:general amino acid permease agp2 [Ophidiomyces ophidiicola]|nr:general amino acid permease agp2 [Ophidiomyces ophidiicola]KAI1987309.1 general amino acid permease agp2 [Ophidiomyces ophidiicola]KAI1990031.1 general amino acid permease agp2 [Ophidiomyces ophidiicola]KAI1990235.1 general amino acid permease agp2 [Ophidiomyces ophidiicola]